MAYADQQGMSRNRMMAFAAVALLHVLLGYAFVTGLALKAVKAIVQPLESVNIKEEAPPPDEPPPPPPKEVDIPPFVPPPEVSIQVDTPVQTITTQTTVQQTSPPVVAPPAPAAPPAPPAIAPTRATDRGRGNTITEEDYPDASLRAGEEGLTRVSIVIDTDGRVASCTVIASSGSARLDDATCKIIQRRFRYNPATQNGQPVQETRTLPIRWQIRDRR